MKTRTVSRLFALFLVFSLVLPLGGCAAGQEDFFAHFRAPFTAQIEGTARGVVFSASIEAGALDENGTRALTLTFYAPVHLADTTISLSPDGTLHLSVGDVTLDATAAKGFVPLLQLFPVSGEVQSVTLTEQGHTRVQGAGFSLDFLPDGTPYRASNSAAEVTVLEFERG